MHTTSMRRSVAAPIDDVFDWMADGSNWATVRGMFYSRVHPADGPEPYGVGSLRDFASFGSKVTEVVTRFERPHCIGYRALSSIPPIRHDGGSITFRAIPGGTEVCWTTTLTLKVPVLADVLTRLFLPLVRIGMVNVTATAERALTRR
ncbi:SRPBCC family protein [Mycolicibacterium sediminis]|uniref:Polyketide cyclase n=1 Tax=Mycolicibacterium sediminis TaxID=1286180 RepID=A0A7I7QZQ9_9MYCO|nr:SRPBCC family protein [Mycolicibacterium sediminis]BBY31854.1 hypothetical protein MSEDJ_59500 [Mycolicibacterium sediminis]